MAVDLEQARAFVQSRFSGARELIALTGGEWSDAFAFRLGADDLVIRFGSHRSDYEKDRLAARYTTAALPIPAIVEIGDAFDGSYAVSTRAHGTPLDALDERAMRSALPSLFAAIAEMRDADLGSTSGFGVFDASGHARFTSWADALLDIAYDNPNHRTYGWRPKLDALPEAGAFAAALAHFRELAAGLPTRRDLVHADLLNRNVFVHDDRVTGLIDWGCAMYGDFLYDVATLSFSTAWFPAWARIDFRAEARAVFPEPDLDLRLDCYEIHIGLGTMAHNAFFGRPADVTVAAMRTLAVIQGATA